MKLVALLIVMTGVAAVSSAQGIDSCNCIRSWVPQDTGNRSCYWRVMAPVAVAEARCQCFLRCTNGRYLNPSYRIWWFIPGAGGGTGGIGGLEGGQAGYAGAVHGWVVLYCAGMRVESGDGSEVQRCDGQDPQVRAFELTCGGGSPN